MKGVGAVTAHWIWRVANYVTETRDGIKALWKALPKHCKKPVKKHGIGKFRAVANPTPQVMVQEIYGCVGNMTEEQSAKFLDDAIKNVIEDVVKDRIFGKLGQGIGKASAQHGRPIGFQAGPAL